MKRCGIIARAAAAHPLGAFCVEEINNCNSNEACQHILQQCIHTSGTLTCDGSGTRSIGENGTQFSAITKCLDYYKQLRATAKETSLLDFCDEPVRECVLSGKDCAKFAGEIIAAGSAMATPMEPRFVKANGESVQLAECVKSAHAISQRPFGKWVLEFCPAQTTQCLDSATCNPLLSDMLQFSMPSPDGLASSTKLVALGECASFLREVNLHPLGQFLLGFCRQEVKECIPDQDCRSYTFMLLAGKEGDPSQAAIEVNFQLAECFSVVEKIARKPAGWRLFHMCLHELQACSSDIACPGIHSHREGSRLQQLFQYSQ